ncbi:MAG: hypothetical protein PHW76_04835 [Alphaproteobacteria bacterium]|nr:hypothetical protein [Alphaproteobacteria bacterium]
MEEKAKKGLLDDPKFLAGLVSFLIVLSFGFVWMSIPDGYSCPSGQALSGVASGRPVCVPVAQGYSCPSGKVLAGLKDGKPMCAALTCRQVVADNNFGDPQNHVSGAACNADEILTGGGGEAEIPGSDMCGGMGRGFMNLSKPQGSTWVVDAYSNDWKNDICSRAVAICCKLAVSE